MTAEMQKILDSELDDAMEANDEPRIMRVSARILSALMDCQRKTAERVKDHLVECDRLKQRFDGAKSLWAALRYIVAAGGGAALLKLLGT